MRPCFVFFFVALAVATISTGEDDDLLSIYVNATIQRAPVETTKFAEVSTTGATTPPPFGAAGPLKTQEAVVVVLSTLLATETETNTTQKIPPAELQTTKTPNAERVEETKTLVASTPTKSESSERTSASPRTTKFPPLSISTKEFQGAHSFAPKEEVHVEPDCSEYQMNASADNKPVIFMPIGRNKKTELKEKIFDDIKCIASNAFILVKVIANETIEEGVQDVCGDWKGFPQAVREHVETESVSLGVVVFVGDEAKNCETDALVGEFSSKNNLKSLMTVQLLANDSQGFNEAFSLNSHASYTYDNLPKAIVFQNISDSLQVVLRRLNTEIRSSSSGHSLVEESTTREPITYDFASYTMVFSVLVVIVFLLLVSLTAYFDDDEELDYYQMGDDCPSTVAEALQNRHREMQMVHVLSTNANLVPCMSSSRTVESDNNCLSARSGSSDVFNTAISSTVTMKLRDSLLFVGEFVGLNKSPDFKLHASSERFLSDAVAQENRVHRNSLHIFIGNDMDYCGPLHSRSQSTSAYSPVSREPDCYRRMSEPAVHGFPSGSYRKISTMSSEEQDRRSEASSRRSSSGSSTFFGSIAAYSNHLNPLTTRL